jgi:preprotein translocase subunit SecY
MNLNLSNKQAHNGQQSLRERILFTLIIISVGRFGTFIPIPGIDQDYLYNDLKNSPILNFFSSFAQGDFFVLGLFTLGILPNINASIIIQLSVSIFPPLQRLQKDEGEIGQQKLNQFTRYLTAAIAIAYGAIIAIYLKPFVFGWDLFKAVEITVVLTTGSLVVLWLSELITEKGIGNGTSIFIFVNIISSLPTLVRNLNTAEVSLESKVFFGLISLFGITSIVIVEGAIRRVPLTSMKGLLRDSINNDSSYLPFRLNPSGIMPIIFASSVQNLLLVGINKLPLPSSFLAFSAFIYPLGYFVLTLFFSYFYSTIAIKPTDLSRDLKNLAFVIPQIQPGLATMKFLQETLNRLALLGGLFLALIVTTPTFLIYLNPDFKAFGNFGTTSLIILVGVAVDLSRQIRTYWINESYDKIML